MKSETKNKIVLVSRVIIALILSGIVMCLISFVYMGLFLNQKDGWESYYLNAARNVYLSNTNIEKLPEHSLNGFPLHFYLIMLISALLLFVVIKKCMRINTKMAVVWSACLFILLSIPIVISSLDYFSRDYRTNVNSTLLLYKNVLNDNDSGDGNIGVVDTIRQHLDEY